MKRVAAALAVLLLTLLPVLTHASQITSIDIVAELHSDGSMRVTDTRIFEATEGTEHYVSIGNLGDSTVSDVSVALDAKRLTDVGKWDVSLSREEKTSLPWPWKQSHSSALTRRRPCGT